MTPEERIEAFKKECMDLSVKYDCDFMCYPQFVPQEDGSFKIFAVMQIVDKTKLASISPLQKDVLFPKE